jgi:hypothetical protein
MMYKAKVAVCSEIHTKHSTQSEYPVEFLNVKPGVRKETARPYKVNMDLMKVDVNVAGTKFCPVAGFGI